MIVLIPAAGSGLRLMHLTENMHKTLIPIGKLPTISRILLSYPSNFKFIILLGFKGNLLKDYIDLTHPKLSIKYIKIPIYSGKKSGLGLSLKYAKKYLKEPFIFHSCDTIVTYNFKELINKKKDSVLLSKKNLDSKKYRFFLIDKKETIKIFDKNALVKNKKNFYNYTGVCYIYNFRKFVSHLNNINIISGESDYFRINNKNKYIFSNAWFDVGNFDGFELAKKKFSDFNNLDKKNEFIYFNDKYVIKYNENHKLIKNLIKRSNNLKGYVPKITDSKKNFIKYKYVKGRPLSKSKNLIHDFNKFLIFYERNFIKKKTIKKIFEYSKQFYYDKTISRIENFYKINHYNDKINYINNVYVSNINLQLKKIDWLNLFNSYPINFHGDLHFENIIVFKNKFKLIDWRESFSGNTKFGDLYYDLAKIYHGILVNHDVIKNEQFLFSIKNNKVEISIKFIKEFDNLLKIFDSWIEFNKLDLDKVKNLTSLIFLNIASLHHHPYNFFLYYLGRLLLKNFDNYKIIHKL